MALEWGLNYDGTTYVGRRADGAPVGEVFQPTSQQRDDDGLTWVYSVGAPGASSTHFHTAEEAMREVEKYAAEHPEHRKT